MIQYVCMNHLLQLSNIVPIYTIYLVDLFIIISQQFATSGIANFECIALTNLTHVYLYVYMLLFLAQLIHIIYVHYMY